MWMSKAALEIAMGGFAEVAVVKLQLQAPPGRFERPACGFEVRRSVQLSYGGVIG